MWAPLLTAAVLHLGPAQAGSLELKNVRNTYWVLGPQRKDSKLLPGDVLIVAFDIVGLKVRRDGLVRYAMGTELTKKGKAKPEYRIAPENKELLISLGGARVPVQAISAPGTDTPPGEYTLKVTVIDRMAKTKATLERTFQVLPTRLGFINVTMAYDPRMALPAPPLAVPGQELWLNFFLVGFRPDKKKQPNVEVEVRILDAATGKPTTKEPLTGVAKKVAKSAPDVIPVGPLPLVLNRSGRFKVVIKATDKVAKKSVEHTIDINVLGPKSAGK
jgi:hypothetical protein